jgi:hypothetical protein
MKGDAAPRRTSPPFKRGSTAGRDRTQRPSLAQYGNLGKCKHGRHRRTNTDSVVILHLVGCKMVQIATCSRRDLAHVLQVLSQGYPERSQAIGRARNIGHLTTKYCGYNDSTEV